MKLIGMVFAVCLLAMPLMAQDKVTSYLIGGGEFNQPEGQFSTTWGGAMQLSPHIWVIGRQVIGSQGALAADIGYFITRGSWRLGLVAGPGVTFAEGSDPVMYMTGSSGFVFGYISSKTGVGCVIGAKNKFVLDDSEYIQEGWLVGAWFVVGI